MRPSIISWHYVRRNQTCSSEYQWWLKFDLGLDVSKGTIVNAFKKLKLTLKDICYNWDEKYTAQNLQWRGQYLAAIAGVDPFRLHFVDEMGYNGYNLGRRRGRTRKGLPCRRSSNRVSRTHFTYQGITSIRPNKPPLIGNVVRGGCSTFHLLAFIFDPAVVATFGRGDIMVMDNVRTHHGPVVEASDLHGWNGHPHHLSPALFSRAQPD